jgi:hypothetical protein
MEELPLKGIENSRARYDVDFYLRKVVRLEGDLAKCQDELSAARIRLRKAEDFELKYEMLAKQMAELSQEHDLARKELVDRRIDSEALREKLDLEVLRKNECFREVSLLGNQVDLLRSECMELERKKEEEIVLLRNRLQTEHAQQMDILRL